MCTISVCVSVARFCYCSCDVGGRSHYVQSGSYLSFVSAGSSSTLVRDSLVAGAAAITQCLVGCQTRGSLLSCALRCVSVTDVIVSRDAGYERVHCLTVTM